MVVYSAMVPYLINRRTPEKKLYWFMSAGPWSIGATQEVGRTPLYNQPLNCKNELQQQTLNIAYVIFYSTCKYFC